jgi:hypothetical protein
MRTGYGASDLRSRFLPSFTSALAHPVKRESFPANLRDGTADTVNQRPFTLQRGKIEVAITDATDDNVSWMPGHDNRTRTRVHGRSSRHDGSGHSQDHTAQREAF